MRQHLRVGAVSYLNAKPLYHRFAQWAPDAALEMDLPSRLSARLALGELDVALIPSVEYLRGIDAGYAAIPNLAIAARGAVRSVKLFSRVPLGSIKRLALDEGSRTSQALTLVWLQAQHGVVPDQVETLPMGVSPLESTADAVLVIGDRAMKVPESPFVAVVDLAAAWNQMTGLPFVFALWVARPGVDLGDLPEALINCRADGLAHADDLAREHAPRLGLDVESCRDYLTRVLSYELGGPELAGLRRFSRMAADRGLVPAGVELVFHRGRHLAPGRRGSASDR